MCGLFGYRTKEHFKLSKTKLKKREAILRSLGVAMEKRGTDSAGIATIEGNRCIIAKDVGPSRSVFQYRETLKALGRNAPLVIGHTRYATVGAVTKKNAHPFRKGDIVGAHNGHVSNYYEIDKTADVDSEVIFSELAKHKNDYGHAFGQLEGAFAIAWSDLRSGDLFLVKSGNPLFTAYVPQLGSLFWCSEEASLYTILYAVMGVDSFTMLPLEEETVYQFDGKLGRKTEEVVFKETPAYVYPGKRYQFEGHYTLAEREALAIERGLYPAEDVDAEIIDSITCCACGDALYVDDGEQAYIDASGELYCFTCSIGAQDYIQLQPFVPTVNLKG